MMHTLYNFVTGPLIWITFIVFVGGSIYRIVSTIVLTQKKEKYIFSYFSLRYSLRSILHWITPFASTLMRQNPILTVITFAFHLCLLTVPVFLFAHIILWDEAWNITWWHLPDAAADVMSLTVIGACIFFLCRRVLLPHVLYVTTISDYLLLAIVAAPFVTGFAAYHQMPGYQWILILHIVSGQIMLMAIPFTRLSHMLLGIFTRSYMGSEFGGVRHARDW